MGDPLSPEILSAFLDEVGSIQKEAAIPGLRAAGGALKRFGQKQLTRMGEGLGGLGRRVLHPVEGMKAGWRDLAPASKYQGMDAAAKAKLKPKFLHLTEANRPLSQSKGARGVAEELSRRGWTGKGSITKYLPAGGKSMTLGFSGLAVPDIVEAAKKEPTPTGEGGVVEKGLGEATGLGGMVLGSGLGFIPSMALWYGANKAGTMAGRVIDRLRGGANLDTAVRAPSPQEAAGQLSRLGSMSPEDQEATISRLRKYYG